MSICGSARASTAAFFATLVDGDLDRPQAKFAHHRAGPASAEWIAWRARPKALRDNRRSVYTPA